MGERNTGFLEFCREKSSNSSGGESIKDNGRTADTIRLLNLWTNLDEDEKNRY